MHWSRTIAIFGVSHGLARGIYRAGCTYSRPRIAAGLPRTRVPAAAGRRHGFAGVPETAGTMFGVGDRLWAQTRAAWHLDLPTLRPRLRRTAWRPSTCWMETHSPASRSAPTSSLLASSRSGKQGPEALESDGGHGLSQYCLTHWAQPVSPSRPTTASCACRPGRCPALLPPWPPLPLPPSGSQGRMAAATGEECRSICPGTR